MLLEDRVLLGKEKGRLPPLKENINKGIAMQAAVADYDSRHQRSVDAFTLKQVKPSKMGLYGKERSMCREFISRQIIN